MFERMKAYKNLKKSNKFLKGVKIMAEVTNDEKLLNDVNETFYVNELLKKRFWKDRKLAERYNLEIIRKGL